jgi:hypothetical protein
MRKRSPARCALSALSEYADAAREVTRRRTKGGALDLARVSSHTVSSRSLRGWYRLILMAVTVSLLGAAGAHAARTRSSAGAPPARPATAPIRVVRATGLRPVLGRSVLASRVSGVVRVKAAGRRTFVLLTQPRSIAVGATIDARRGTVKLVTAASAVGKTQSGRFSRGSFTVFQEHSDRTDLRLVGGRPARALCGSKARANGAAVGVSSSVSSRVLRLLHAHARGHFRTVGRYTAATVRGTEWQTIDRCDGTLTVDTKGVVDATTGTLTFSLKPGQTAIGYCFPPNATPQTRQLCIVEVSQPADGLFGFGIGLRRAATSYRLCIRAPSGTERCRPFLLGAPNAAGVRTSSVVCPQDEGAGGYFVRWLVGGRQLGVTLPFRATLPAPPTSQSGCISRP